MKAFYSFILTSLLFASASSQACQQPKCRTYKVCSEGDKHPTCQMKTVCEGGTCGAKAFEAFLGSQEIVLDSSTSNAILSLMDIPLDGSTGELTLMGYVTERADPAYDYRAFYRSDDHTQQGQGAYEQKIIEGLFESLRYAGVRVSMVAQGSSYILIDVTIQCEDVDGSAQCRVQQKN